MTAKVWLVIDLSLINIARMDVQISLYLLDGYADGFACAVQCCPSMPLNLSKLARHSCMSSHMKRSGTQCPFLKEQCLDNTASAGIQLNSSNDPASCSLILGLTSSFPISQCSFIPQSESRIGMYLDQVNSSSPTK